MTRLFWILIVLSLFPPYRACASSAEVMLVPTRVVFENNDRYNTIVVKNVGDAAGDYTVDLVDMKMLDSGAVVPLNPGESAQYSAIPYLRIAPKSMTLPPGATQNIRLVLRKPEGLEPGEYRAHVRLRMIHDNASEAANKTGKGPTILVQANLAIVIPVIARTGATTLSVGIIDAKLSHDARGTPAVDMYLTREGTRSAMGDISVTYTPQNGVPHVIKVFRGVAVYRPTPRRFVSVPLDETPNGLNLSHGRLDIVYATQEKEGGKKLAETQITLP